MMNDNIVLMPGYRLNEYLLVISPNESLRNKIKDIKKDFSEKYKAGVVTTPHLTLAKFVTWNMMEERLVNRFRQIAMGFCPFKIELKDYGSFPSHTIYINVTTRTPVQQLSRELRSAQRMMKAHPDYDPHFINEPHITIARGLKPWQYEKSWQEYSQKNFTAKLIGDGMLLLKRPLNREERTYKYEIVERFDFLNLPVSVTQGELF